MRAATHAIRGVASRTGCAPDAGTQQLFGGTTTMLRRRRRTRRAGQFPPVVVVGNESSLSDPVKSAKRRRPDEALAIHQRLRKQAAITRAVMDAWLAGRSVNETCAAAKREGFQGNLMDLWFVLQRGTGWPDVLWDGPAARRSRRTGWTPRKVPARKRSGARKHRDERRHAGGHRPRCRGVDDIFKACHSSEE